MPTSSPNYNLNTLYILIPMGKKYIPIKIQDLTYKIYLDNLIKIYKVTKRSSLPIPLFQKKSVSRKDSLDTSSEEGEEGVTMSTEQ